MAKSEEQQALELIRDVENRLVWLASFLVIRGLGARLDSAADCASQADKALDEYQQRFDPIKPG